MSASPTSLPLQRVGFSRILCAIDGSRGSAEAVRQTLVLCDRGGTITFVAVTDLRGVGANRMASLGEHRANQALAAAQALARDRGFRAERELVHSPDIVETLLERADAHDLLAIGSHDETRSGGIALGSVASSVVHRAIGAVLVARPAPTAIPFPRRLILALPNGPEADALVEHGGRLAAACDGEVHLIHVEKALPRAEDRHRLAVLTVRIGELTGVEPLVDTPIGSVPQRITELARATDASLVLVGRRGLRGVRALGSVSERVAHLAPCSVMIMPIEMARQARG